MDGMHAESNPCIPPRTQERWKAGWMDETTSAVTDVCNWLSSTMEAGDGDANTTDMPPSKRWKSEADGSERGEALLAEAEAALQAREGGVSGDPRGAKRIYSAFEKKRKANLEARSRHAEEPEAYMESELELHEEMVKLKELAGVPEQGAEFVRLQLVHSLVALLAHENADVAALAVEVLEELTSEDVREESGENTQRIVQAVCEAGGVEHLAESLERFDENVAEEAMAVFHVLSTVENLVEIKLDMAERFGQSTNLMEWLVHRLQKQEFDSNKQYASEILAILLQSSEKNQLKFGEKNGIELLLRAIAQYRNKEPDNEDEAETLENVFDALCSSLLTQENKKEFLIAEGVELMVILLKAKTKVHGGALKVLDYGMANNGDAVERFVERLGLRSLFKCFASSQSTGKGSDTMEMEARCVSIIANLLQCALTKSTWQRTAAKFVESDYEKCGLVFDLIIRYSAKVRAVEEKLEEELGEGAELDLDDAYLERLDGGLYTLQQATIIFAHIWSAGDNGAQERFRNLMQDVDMPPEYLPGVLWEMYEAIGETGGRREQESQKKKIKRLIINLEGLGG